MTLIIIPCGERKTWDKCPDAGPTLAPEAYIGKPFIVNKAFAERFATKWVILSAKYGFIKDFVIPCNYDVSFKRHKRKSAKPVAVAALIEQIREQKLYLFNSIIALGGEEYRDAITEAFAAFKKEVAFPFAGLYPPGVASKEITRAIEAEQPYPVDEISTVMERVRKKMEATRSKKKSGQSGKRKTR